MLFKLENCTPDKYAGNINKQVALANILTSHGQKKNIVIANDETLIKLINSNLYSVACKTFARDIMDTRIEYGNLPKKLSIFCVIDFDSKSMSCSNINGVIELRLSYFDFIDSESSGAISLLTENSRDHSFYMIIASFYSKFISGKNLAISFRETLGAGSHSKSVFDSLTLKKKILLCIVDNDKPHPLGPMQSTSSAFKAMDKEYNNNSLAKVLNVREVESLIPTEIMENCIVKKSKSSVSVLDEIKKYHFKSEDFRRYFDHKDGIALKDAIRLDNLYGTFWLDFFSEKNKDKQCFVDRKCYACGNCPAINGLGDKILEQSIIEINSLNPKKLKNMIDTNIITDWYDIGETLMSWGCAGYGRTSRT